MLFDGRASGIQLHVTSLPGGRLGPAAFEWIDWLAEAGQSWWQVLPLGPPDRYGSPYKSASAFAAWPGLLAEPDAPVADDEIDAFAAAQPWVEGWARFAAHSRSALVAPGASGSEDRERPAARRAIADQVRFEREWGAVRAHAAARGVRILGDVPIYVAPGSADHAASPELFRDDEVAGAPPDAYSEKGQLWGNPMYDWPAMQRRGYAWWVARVHRTLQLFDAARIDHFRGFVAGWGTPLGARDARGGHWRRGPGKPLFDALAADLGTHDLPFVAEDLGVITEPVTRLRERLGLPGMVVLQFAFDPEDPRGPHRLENHTPDRVAYTGTHDSDTLAGWWEELETPRRAEATRALVEGGFETGSPVWDLTALWMTSVAPLVMLQGQDLLELGSQARMNTPGRARGNWSWQLPAGALDAALAERLRDITAGAGRA